MSNPLQAHTYTGSARDPGAVLIQPPRAARRPGPPRRPPPPEGGVDEHLVERAAVVAAARRPDGAPPRRRRLEAVAPQQAPHLRAAGMKHFRARFPFLEG